jgi:hypothetical protein
MSAVTPASGPTICGGLPMILGGTFQFSSLTADIFVEGFFFHLSGGKVDNQ